MAPAAIAQNPAMDVHAQAQRCLMERDPETKLARVRELDARWPEKRPRVCDGVSAPEPIAVPGRPPRPRLVSPREVERRQVSTPEGRAALLHALAHIEFNAVNLALDAVYRFRGLPFEYYGDWVRVAAEEAHHFALLRERLRALGHDYGDFTAHDGLWEMAVKTAHDPLARMALVPRVLEARGLDASPTLIAKLRACGDARAVEIMAIIQRDEIGHVAVGSRWYRYLCGERGLDPVATFRRLLREYDGPRLRGPFDHVARRRAGFTEQELDLIEELAAGR
ncbi:hypothetical protein SVA_3552 [Sulfurifustis variabilis]|uniref:Uncharacterized protein n=2 Tax=Sulfurifustis variabilis TaxID=1675686 RepID=A0A1C7AFI2_9GAMM|nr:hypothetical protein SVA_3552 [Sulfurifustis variabilis]